MFEGSYPLTLDAKGRLTLPAELRPKLEECCGGQLTLARHFGPFLRLYPRPEWERFRGYMAENFTMKLENTRRLIIGSADSLQMDGAGRILINPLLRKAAKLDRQVVLVGDVSRFEIWDEDTLARHLDAQVEAGMPEELFGVLGV